MKPTAQNLKEKSVINKKIGNYTFYRLILTEPACKILDIVRKGRYFYKYVGMYDIGNNPLTLLNDLELIENLIFE